MRYPVRTISPLLVAFAVLVQGTALRAQGLAPFRAEYHKQAKGLLTLINDKDVPVRITLRPKSFTSDSNGRLQLLPLDPNLNLVLAQTTLLIPPKETRYVSYESKPKTVPAWFAIYVTFTPDQSGIAVGTTVPHFAYITAGNPKSSELEMTATYNSGNQLLRMTFLSHSQQLAHVEQLETSGGKMKKDLGSLSVLPGKSTVVEAKMEGSERPGTVKANFGKFKLQCQVAVQE